MSQLNLPLEQPKEVLELKLEISNMQDDLKAYENLHKKFVENFMYSIHKSAMSSEIYVFTIIQ